MKIKNKMQKKKNPSPVENTPNVNPKINPDDERSLFTAWLIYSNCSLAFTLKVLEIQCCKSSKTLVNCFSKWGISLENVESWVPKK